MEELPPFCNDTENSYISSNSILNRLAVNLVTGSNVFNNLYVFMSDNIKYFSIHHVFYVFYDMGLGG